MKTCFKCHRSLPVEQFYKHPEMADGRLGKCKDCAKNDVKKRYAGTRKAKSDYERRRNRTAKRRAMKLKYQKLRIGRNPTKAAVYSAVSNAVRRGDLKKEPCIHCGKTKVQAHHRDYSKPLDVVWVCFKCHREIEHGQVVSSDFE